MCSLCTQSFPKSILADQSLQNQVLLFSFSCLRSIFQSSNLSIFQSSNLPGTPSLQMHRCIFCERRHIWRLYYSFISMSMNFFVNLSPFGQQQVAYLGCSPIGIDNVNSAFSYQHSADSPAVFQFFNLQIFQSFNSEDPSDLLTTYYLLLTTYYLPLPIPSLLTSVPL